MTLEFNPSDSKFSENLEALSSSNLSLEFEVFDGDFSFCGSELLLRSASLKLDGRWFQFDELEYLLVTF